MIPKFRRLGVAAVLLAAVPTLAAAQTLSEGYLVTRLGRDTLSVERFQREANRVTGRVVRRVPRAAVVEYDVTVGKSGRPEHATFRLMPPPGATGGPAPRKIEVTLRADSAVAEEVRDTLVRRAWGVGNAYLWMPDSYALSELWLGTVQRPGPEPDTVRVVGPLGGATGGLAARRPSRNLVTVVYSIGTFEFRTDDRGRLQSLDGMSSPVKHMVSRVASFDLDGFAAHSVALEKSGRSLGAVVSPRDTARAVVGACSLWVDYGRPSKRGRKVFEHGVLGDSLWRTGANAATQFSTSRDLKLGGHALPAGKYTLFTRAVGDGYVLLVNSQTGQWGTVHDPARDLLVLPLQRKALGETVELFTIRIDSGAGPGSVLRLQWDDTELSVPIEVGS